MVFAASQSAILITLLREPPEVVSVCSQCFGMYMVTLISTATL